VGVLSPSRRAWRFAPAAWWTTLTRAATIEAVGITVASIAVIVIVWHVAST
jgi:hypothetical protein